MADYSRATPWERPCQTLRTAVVGVGGYAGAELARLLLHHPRLASSKPLFLGRVTGEASSADVPLERIHPQLALGGDKAQPKVFPFSWELVRDAGTQLVYLALPHESSRQWVPEWLDKDIRVIDLSGAWRLHDQQNREVYDFHDVDARVATAVQEKAVYGCPELHREKIAEACLVANPGCYATSIILALAPLLRAGMVDVNHGIICDAKSGVSGAGKALSATSHFMYAADNLSAYAVFGHRHTGELLEQLGLSGDQIIFTPHLLPIPRGILSTLYLRLANFTQPEEVELCLRSFYAKCEMVRVRATPALPQIQHVVQTNFCDLGFKLAKDGRRLILISCLDNLLKGAAGQAIQNMNLMCGWNEGEGLQ